MIKNIKFRYLKHSQDLYKLRYDGSYVILNNMRFFERVIEGLLNEGVFSNLLSNKCIALLQEANDELGKAVEEKHFTRKICERIRQVYQVVDDLASQYPMDCPQACNGYEIIELVNAVTDSMRRILSKEYQFNNRFFKEFKAMFLHSSGERPHIVSIFGGINFYQKFIDGEIELHGSICKSELPYRFRYNYIYVVGLRNIIGKLSNKLQLIQPHVDDFSLTEKINRDFSLFHMSLDELSKFSVKVSGYGRFSYEEINQLCDNLCYSTENLDDLLCEVAKFVEHAFDAALVKPDGGNNKIRKQAIRNQLNRQVSDCRRLVDILKAGIGLCIFRFCGGEIRKYGELVFIPGQGINLLNDRELLDSLF